MSSMTSSILSTQRVTSFSHSKTVSTQTLSMIDKCLPEVYNILASLDITKFPGCDEISDFVNTVQLLWLIQ